MRCTSSAHNLENIPSTLYGFFKYVQALVQKKYQLILKGVRVGHTN